MSKHITFLIAFCLSSSLLIGQGSIDFTSKKWTKVLSKASNEGKPIFIDAYTTWCGPCKWMDKHVFKNEVAADFYNDNFINVKYDMEESEGMAIAQKYAVDAYPTFLFITANGKEIHRAFGARDVDEFILLGQLALDPTRRLEYFADNYYSKKSDPAFLKSYASALDVSGQSKKMDIVYEYLRTQDNWLTPDNIEFIFHFTGYDIDEELFTYVVDHRDSFYEVVGEQKVDTKLVDGLIASLGPGATMDHIELQANQVFGDKSARYVDYLKLEHYLSMSSLNNKEDFIGFVNYYFNKYDVIDWTTLNNMAWRVYEIAESTLDLQIALKIADKSVKMNSNYYNNDTLAAVLYKMRQKDDAMYFAKQAIQIAKENGDDPSQTYNLIKLIEKLD